MRDVPQAIAWILPLLLVGLGLAAYSNSFGGAFVFDDHRRIVENMQIRHLWPPWAVVAGSTRPVVDLTLALNHAVGGLDPWGYHAVNVAIHIAAGLLLYGIVRRMLGSRRLAARFGANAHALAAAVAGIWLVHPLNTAAVTYVIQRAESLMGMFYLLTIYCGIRACASLRPRRWSVAAVAACALGMGSKEVMVTAPVLLLLYDWMFVARSLSEALGRRGGLYAGLCATWLVLGGLLLSASLAPDRPVEAVMIAGVTPFNYALTQFEVIVHYLRLALWPQPLILDYLWRIADPLSSVAPFAAVVLALAAGTVLAVRRRMWIGFWGAWFFVILAPTSSVMPIADLAFEHRMYLSLAAVAAIAVIGGHDLLRRAGLGASLRASLESVLVVALVAALGLATLRRNEDYRSEIAIYADNVAKRPDNPRAHYNLGLLLDRAGRRDEAIVQYREVLRLDPRYVDAQSNLGAALAEQGRLDAALAELTAAVRLHPDSARTHNNLGLVLGRRGNTAGAIAEYSEAVRLDPGSAEMRRNLGDVLVETGNAAGAAAQFAEAQRLDPSSAGTPHVALGHAFAQQGRTREALAQYGEALRQKPDEVAAHTGMASVLARAGKLDEALSQYREVLRLEPDSAEAHSNLGTVLFRLGRIDEAIAEYGEALRLKPDFADAAFNLGVALDRQGKRIEAIARYREAVRLDPGNTQAHYSLGVDLAAQGRTDEAIAQYHEALQLDPDHAQAHNNLGAALAGQGRLDEAIAHFATAVRLEPGDADARNNLRTAQAARGPARVAR